MKKAKSRKELMAGRGQAADADRSRLEWWREARFGLFIHWGLYAIPAGVWNGKAVQGLGEWIMYNARIPVKDYEKLAGRFDPVEFDADEWVDIAKRAGMRYLVITAKHHDGFALFESACSSYNIAAATPFGRDVLAELAKACVKAGLRLGFYYSQDQDWHDPDGAWNDWDYDEEAKDFDRYFRGKVIPQVTELLTKYGPVGLIWFDTPYTIGERHSKELRELVHRLQPDCLVNGRVGNDMGDYGSLGDNQIPVGTISGDYETPATMNDTWGFRSDDHNWKSAETLLYLLIDLAGKGINYLLNVGPDEKGRIPAASVERLERIGAWLRVNGQAVYGTQAGPFPYELSWGRITSRGAKLYLIFFRPPRDGFELFGLRNRVLRGHVLGGGEIEVTQVRDDSMSHDSIRLSGFGGKDPGLYPVVALDLEGEPEVDELPLQQPDGSVTLPAFMAEIDAGAGTGPAASLEITRAGFTDEWHDIGTSIGWTFKLVKPGRFEVRVLSSAPGAIESRNQRQEKRGDKPHRIAVMAERRDGGGKAGAEGDLTADVLLDTPRARHHREAVTVLGEIDLAEPGIWTLSLRALFIDPAPESGLSISGVELVPPVK